MTRLLFQAYRGRAEHLKQTQAAVDASVTIDGSSTATTSTTNTFKFTTGGLAGVTLNVNSLKGADGIIDTTQLDIGRDNAAATNAVKAFVDGFNSLAGTIKSLTGYNAKTKQAGALQGDAGVRSVDSQLRKMLGQSVDKKSCRTPVSRYSGTAP
ncbi:MAG: flagellar filament capping protein FliD [Candidatus Competibacteraceae bacterium]|nr:flagellar filament capping protein FliD [Candidatus Competibacteraceae bacterium]